MSFSFGYPSPPIAALMDILYFSRSFDVRPIPQTIARIQSFTSFSQDLLGLYLFLWPFTFTSSMNLLSVWCLLYVQNYFICVRSVPDVTPSSSYLDWFVLCSVHDTRNSFL